MAKRTTSLRVLRGILCGTGAKGTNTHFPEVTFPILTNVPVKNNRL